MPIDFGGLMNKPTNPIEKNLLDVCKKYNIETDLTKRWENFEQHHPKAEKLAREIGGIDWMFGDDCFGFKFGGDGDNGEFLTHYLDIIFELEDAIKRSADNQPD